MRSMHSPTRLVAAFVFAFALLIALAVLAIGSVNQLVASAEQETAAQARVTAIEEFNSALERVSAAVTRYLVEGSEPRYTAYAQAKESVLASYQRLFERVGDTPDQRERLSQTGKMLRLRLIELDHLMRLIRTRAPLPPAPDSWPYDTLGPARSANLDVNLSRTLTELRVAELDRIATRRLEVQEQARRTVRLIVYGGLFTLMLMVGAAWFAQRGAARQRVAEAQLRTSQERVRKLIDSIPGMTAYIDRDRVMRYHNRAYRDFIGKSAAALEGRPHHEILDEAVRLEIEPHMRAALRGETVNFERTQRNAQGVWRVLACNFTPDFGSSEDGNDTVIGYFALLFDITERKNLERLKSDFVAMVSHELRTPLTAIMGALGLVCDADAATRAADPQSFALLDIAARNAERLTRLINDVLDLEKIEAGKMDFHPRPIELLPLLHDAIAANRSYAEPLGVALALTAAPEGEPEESLHVIGDSDRLMQVLTNLISNACKVSQRGQTVDISCRVSGACARVSVRDAGPGIAPEFQPLVFEKFAQASQLSGHAAPIKGTGLGLPICKALVEQMGGTIGFRSPAPLTGMGTVFFFEVPLAQTHVVALD